MDIKFKREDFRFKCRANGLILRGDKILIVRHEDNKHFNLPGGHIEIGETSAAALKREVFEEAGIEITSEKLFCITENIYENGTRHEIAFYYTCVPLYGLGMEFTGEKTVVKLDHGKEKTMLFKWVTKDEFRAIRFMPLAVKDLIMKDDIKTLKHIAINELL